MTFQHPITRRQFASRVGCVALAMARPAAQAQSRPEKPKIMLAVDAKASFAYLPLTIADQLGYFREEGLDILINDYADAASATQALLAGAADICCGPFERLLNLQAKNQLVKAFVLQSRTPQIAFGTSTRSGLARAGVRDLRGKKIGVLSLDSSAMLLTQLLLFKSGVNIQEVTVMPMGSAAAALAAIRAGQIDALCSADPVMTMLEQKGDVKIICDTRSLRGSAELFGGLMPSACLYASQEFLLKNANTCQALAYAIVRSLKWLQTAGPRDIIKTVPDSYLLGDGALYLASFNKIRQSISRDGLRPADGPVTALTALSRFDSGLQQANVDVKKTYTNLFAARAKERFKA